MALKKTEVKKEVKVEKKDQLIKVFSIKTAKIETISTKDFDKKNHLNRNTRQEFSEEALKELGIK